MLLEDMVNFFLSQLKMRQNFSGITHKCTLLNLSHLNDLCCLIEPKNSSKGLPMPEATAPQTPSIRLWREYQVSLLALLFNFSFSFSFSFIIWETLLVPSLDLDLAVFQVHMPKEIFLLVS